MKSRDYDYKAIAEKVYMAGYRRPTSEVVSRYGVKDADWYDTDIIQTHINRIEAEMLAA